MKVNTNVVEVWIQFTDIEGAALVGMCERGLEQKDEQDEIGEAGEDQESDKRIEGSELEDNLSIKSILQNVDVSEFTSLIASCQNGHGTTAQLLLANNADP
eukprot:215935_1